MNKTSDFIDFKTAITKGFDILDQSGGNDKKFNPVIGFYIIASIHLGLRVSDTLKLRHEHLMNKKAGDKLEIQEKKTGKVRTLTLNENLIKAYKILVNTQKLSGPVFKSCKGVYTPRALNRILKEVFDLPCSNVSTHSLRKSFGRAIFENNNESDKSLIILSDIFNHGKVSTTRRYLGLTSEEISSIYMNL